MTVRNRADAKVLNGSGGADFIGDNSLDNVNINNRTVVFSNEYTQVQLYKADSLTGGTVSSSTLTEQDADGNWIYTFSSADGY